MIGIPDRPGGLQTGRAVTRTSHRLALAGEGPGAKNLQQPGIQAGRNEKTKSEGGGCEEGWDLAGSEILR